MKASLIDESSSASQGQNVLAPPTDTFEIPGAKQPKAKTAKPKARQNNAALAQSKSGDLGKAGRVRKTAKGYSDKEGVDVNTSASVARAESWRQRTQLRTEKGNVTVGTGVVVPPRFAPSTFHDGDDSELIVFQELATHHSEAGFSPGISEALDQFEEADVPVIGSLSGLRLSSKPVWKREKAVTRASVLQVAESPGADSSKSRSSLHQASVPAKGGIWPNPFPGYKGLFTYEVKGDSRETDKSLGNGVYLWMLEILPWSVHIGEPASRSATSVDFHCQMRKKLVSLPEDASDAMKNVLNQFVTEQWWGRAEIDSRVFRLDDIGTEPIECTINFDGLPLDRMALAGQYEMELSRDDSVVKAIHVSWMHFANLTPDEASGFMFRITEASPVCPVLRPAVTEELERKLQEACELLHGSKVYQHGDVHRVRYWPSIFRVPDIEGMTGNFKAELQIGMDYLVSRDDVFEYIIRPAGWKPRWYPKIFEALNAYDLEALRTDVDKPTLKVLEGGEGREIRAEIVITYRGTFEERFELQNFPFDVQPLHVKLHVDQDSGVEMAMAQQDHGLSRNLKATWGNTEWRLLDCSVGHAHKGNKIGHQGITARLFVSCRVQRHARSYLIRIIGVIVLICMLSVCIFVIDKDNLAEMLGHAFMMLLTLTTFSLVVGDILPHLGYLTLLDNIVLYSFAFLAMIVLQITYLGFQIIQDEDGDYARVFAIGDVIGLCVSCIGMTTYVNCRVTPSELRKQCSNPKDDFAANSVSRTQHTIGGGRFSHRGISTEFKEGDFAKDNSGIHGDSTEDCR